MKQQLVMIVRRIDRMQVWRRVTRMRFIPSIFASIFLLGIAAPASTAEFIVQIGSPVGTPTCGNVNTGVSGTPVSRELGCSSVPGGLDARAAALFGHVGGSSGATVGSGYFGTAFGINTISQFSDSVTFASDPSVGSVLIAANLAFSGTMNATASANAGVDLFYSLIGPGLIYAASNSGVVRNDFNVAEGSGSGALSSALLRTGMMLVPTNQPLLMTLRLGTGAGVGGSGSPESASSDFSNSFEVPFGIDAFVLPDGITANAGDWLVDNRRVDPSAVGAVPEPSTWALMIAGFIGMGAVLRIRRRRAASP